MFWKRRELPATVARRRACPPMRICVLSRRCFSTDKRNTLALTIIHTNAHIHTKYLRLRRVVRCRSGRSGIVLSCFIFFFSFRVKSITSYEHNYSRVLSFDDILKFWSNPFFFILFLMPISRTVFGRKIHRLKRDSPREM